MDKERRQPVLALNFRPAAIDRILTYMDTHLEVYPQATRAHDLARVLTSDWFEEIVAETERKVGIRQLLVTLLRMPSPWKLARPDYNDN